MAGVPVTLTYNDEYVASFECTPWLRRAAQGTTDANATCAFSFIMRGILYVCRTQDTSGLTPEECLLLRSWSVALECSGGVDWRRVCGGRAVSAKVVVWMCGERVW